LCRSKLTRRARGRRAAFNAVMIAAREANRALSESVAGYEGRCARGTAELERLERENGVLKRGVSTQVGARARARVAA
jgi:hypothetical protein